jgi:hypothetical protein
MVAVLETHFCLAWSTFWIYTILHDSSQSFYSMCRDGAPDLKFCYRLPLVMLLHSLVARCINHSLWTKLVVCLLWCKTTEPHGKDTMQVVRCVNAHW